jgi:L-aspartate oxidase
VEIGPPAEATRAALWRHAGLRRDPGGLRELLADPHPLARLIAVSCLAREESRGAHQRTDAPATDPALDGMHTLVGAGAEPRFERWN